MESFQYYNGNIM